MAVVALDVALLALGLPIGILDARLAYSPSEALALIERLGEEGRRLYRWIARLDLCFIALYSLFLQHLLRRLVLGERRGRKALALARAAALADLAETAGILALLRLHPTAPYPLAVEVAIATPAKWACFAALAWAIAGARASARPKPGA